MSKLKRILFLVAGISFFVSCRAISVPLVPQEVKEIFSEPKSSYSYEAHPQYQRLKKLLDHYQIYEGVCPKVLSNSLNTPEGRELLAQNLKRHGFWGLGSGLVSTLEEALKSFQRSRGLEATGKLTPRTVELLNQPLSIWMGHILSSLKRLEKIKNFEPKHVLVNIPSFTIHGYDGPKEVYQSPVLVGKDSTPTPELQGLIASVITHPTWFVPRDLVEKLQGSVGYKGYTWSDGRLIQRPGPHNSLGNIKFKVEGPSQNIILHGTNKPHLFKKSCRKFSHGCVRVQDTQGLLKFVGEDPEATQAAQAVADNKSKTFPLRKKIPLYITYLRVWVDNNGHPHFLPDVYDQENSSDDDEDSEDYE